MNRKIFLKFLAAGVVSTGSPVQWAIAGGYRRPGLALYTVIDALREDFEGTLEAVAEIGYREVESIATMGRNPAEVRAMLAKYGLQSTSQHMAPADLYAVFDKIVRNEITLEQLTQEYLKHFNRKEAGRITAEAIERAQALGQTYVCWPIVFEQQLTTEDRILEMCDAFNVAGKLCAEAGLVFCFHNHAVEFKPVAGKIPYEVFLENTDPETVKMQADLFWMTYAGVDPFDYLERYPNRFVQAHLKDITADKERVDVGKGVVDFERFLRAARGAGIQKWYVEYDKPPQPLESARIAYEYLTSL